MPRQLRGNTDSRRLRWQSPEPHAAFAAEVFTSRSILPMLRGRHLSIGQAVGSCAVPTTNIEGTAHHFYPHPYRSESVNNYE
jgi:hypothetical protein